MSMLSQKNSGSQEIQLAFKCILSMKLLIRCTELQSKNSDIVLRSLSSRTVEVKQKHDIHIHQEKNIFLSMYNSIFYSPIYSEFIYSIFVFRL
jgi:hypothetical protein